MFNIYYYKNPRYSTGKIIVKTTTEEKEAQTYCDYNNNNGGYEDEEGNNYMIDYEVNEDFQNDVSEIVKLWKIHQLIATEQKEGNAKESLDDYNKKLSEVAQKWNVSFDKITCLF